MNTKKILILIIFTLALLITSLYAAVPDKATNLFYTGNALYEQGKYEEAVEKYKEIIEEGYAFSSLYYNLGNCYFKLGLLGKTILYYERAKQINPGDPELNFNLNYVHSLLKDKTEVPRKNWIMRKLNSTIHSLSLGKWIGLSALIWLVLSISAIIAVFSARFRKAFKYIGIISLFLLIIGFINIFVLLSESASPQAVVLSKEVPVRYGPGEGEVEAFLLHEGTKVAVKAQKGAWLQMRLPDGKTGWLPQNAVEKI